MSNLSQSANGAMAAGITGGGVGTGLSLTEIITANAVVITVSCTVTGVLIGLLFHIINSIINQRRSVIQAKAEETNQERLQLQRAEKIEQWLSQGKTKEQIQELLQLAKDL